VIYLFKNKEIMKRMGEESKIKANLYDWDIIAKQTRDIYEKINTTRKSRNE